MDDKPPRFAPPRPPAGEHPVVLQRRRFMRGAAGMALASGLSSAGGASGGVAAATAAGPGPGSPAADLPRYRPSYFTDAEWAFINAAVGRLIPHDGNGPGGVDAGVPEFLDRQMALPYGHGAYWYMQGPFHPELAPTLGYQLRQTPRELYRAGIALVDQLAMTLFDKPFARLPAPQADDLLGQVEQGHIAHDAILGAAFFALLLRNTREGYFADPQYGGNRDMAAWKLIGFPGARADFTDWIEQPGKAYPYGPVSLDGKQG
jgi:gluconate 2-dehydrogenase gamma chain